MDLNPRQLIRLAVTTATDNARQGQRPYAALVVADGTVLGDGVNTVLQDNDPTAHAEVTAIRAACARTGRRDLTGAVLIASCRPCPMCQAVARLVGIGTIYHAGQCRTPPPQLPDLELILVPDDDLNRPFVEFEHLGMPDLDRPAAKPLCSPAEA
ncbi:nucleoside deaminase [Plantactinospora sp. GCM10030261]|uniref:nucleoside deaminase n=1 Tax=Plantactinospora sp. GCM10030261 TaxID=3273420 RepID=UPI00361F8689